VSHEVEQRVLASYLDDNNLKHTRQREAILEVFLETRGHVTSEDLSRKVRELYPHIGYTTVLALGGTVAFGQVSASDAKTVEPGALASQGSRAEAGRPGVVCLEPRRLLFVPKPVSSETPGSWRGTCGKSI
jgi:hypothetical protein